jgi:transcriptional regulator of acetoin/glycerol metabolism
VLERARLFADDGIVRLEHLPESLNADMPKPLALTAAATQALNAREISDAELRRLAEISRGTRKELARQAGLSERTLYRRLKGLGLA